MPTAENAELPNAGWPRSVRRFAGVCALLHLSAVGLHVFGNRSGPWATPGGLPVRQPPPPFVHLPFARAAAEYLGALRLDETGRFPALYSDGLIARLEAVSPAGEILGQLPEPSAWWLVRQRQQALANALLTDVAVAPEALGERSYAAGPPPLVAVWRSDGDKQPLKLVRVSEHEVSRDPNRREYGPAPWQQALARSYARRMGGEAATLRRYWSVPLPLATALSPAAATPELARAELADRLTENRSDYGKQEDAEP